MDLQDKVALVTGGARRLGKAICLTFAARGCRVIVHHHRSATDARQTVSTVESLGSQALALRADLTRAEEVDRMIQAAFDRFGHLDILVNNAAVFGRTPIGTVSLADWEYVMGLNLHGTFLCAQRIGLRMREAGQGRIINVSDVAALRPWADYVPYSVSKACVLTLTHGLALELAPEVLVNAVIPGPMLFQPDTPHGVREREIGKTLVKRAGTPDELAKLVAFVAESDYSTGSFFTVDGGRSLT